MTCLGFALKFFNERKQEVTRKGGREGETEGGRKKEREEKRKEGRVEKYGKILIFCNCLT